MREFETILPILSAATGRSWEDDVASLAAGPARIITVDALVEGIHFLPTDPVDTVARKLVRVNVSDILAKGALPAEALLTLGWPDRLDQAALGAFAGALCDDLRAWGAGLIGGDTVRSPERLFLSLTLTGDCLGAGPVRRSGGQAGDLLYVTGRIGAGGLGLEAARRAEDAAPHLAHYRVPDLPPRAVAGFIANHARAAMDISDGLLGDALKLAAASGCGAAIDLSRIPYAGPAESVEARLDQARAGDDYQALMAIAPAGAGAAEAAAEAAGLRITAIGELAGTGGLDLRDGGHKVEPPADLSFQHSGPSSRQDGPSSRPGG